MFKLVALGNYMQYIYKKKPSAVSEVLIQNLVLSLTGKLEVYVLHQKGFFAWKTRLLNAEGSLEQVKYCKAAFANIHFYSAKLFGPTMFILVVCYSWIFAHMFWGSLLFLPIPNLHANQGMCQMSASPPDYLLFPRVKAKQNVLVFQAKEARKQKNKGLWLCIANGWNCCQRSPASLEENSYGQLISAALLHLLSASVLLSCAWVVAVSGRIVCYGVRFCT